MPAAAAPSATWLPAGPPPITIRSNGEDAESGTRYPVVNARMIEGDGSGRGHRRWCDRHGGVPLCGDDFQEAFPADAPLPRPLPIRRRRAERIADDDLVRVEAHDGQCVVVAEDDGILLAAGGVPRRRSPRKHVHRGLEEDRLSAQ